MQTASSIIIRILFTNIFTFICHCREPRHNLGTLISKYVDDVIRGEVYLVYYNEVYLFCKKYLQHALTPHQ